MTKKVTKTTVYWMSEKNEAHLNRLDKAMELIKKVMNDKDIDNHSYSMLQEVLYNCMNARRSCEIHFTEETTEEVEEIID